MWEWPVRDGMRFFPPKMTGSGWDEIFSILSEIPSVDRGQKESCVLPALLPACPNSATPLYRAPNPRPNALWCGSDTKKPRFCTSILQPSEVNNIQKVATLNFDDKIWKKKNQKGMFFCIYTALLAEGDGNIILLPFFLAVSGWILKSQHRLK